MADYSSWAAAIAREAKHHEAALTLIDEGCYSQLLLQEERPEKVFLLLHGFTATPAQFLPIGKTLFEAGHNVLIPLLPGHGLAGDWNGDNPPPLPEDFGPYRVFCQQWLDYAQHLGRQVYVGGLSSGGTLAAWLALEYWQRVARSLLFAPYLSGTNPLVNFAVRVFDIYFQWHSEPGVTSFGYGGFAMPALRLFLDLGQEILERAEQEPMAPMFIISSKSDRAVSHHDHWELFRHAVQHQPKTWHHCFEKSLDVPHNMMTSAEGNGCVELLFEIVKAYVDSDLTWQEVEAIRDRVAQGESFDAVVSASDWSDRTSPALKTLVMLMI